MQSEIRHQGEIIHLHTSDGFIQIIIQDVNRETGQVQLGFITPSQVSLVGGSAYQALVNSEVLGFLSLQKVS